MEKYQCVLFDMDGTVADSQKGIVKSIIHTLNTLGIEETNMSKLRSFVGPPLKNAFMENYNMNAKDAEKAVAIFRDYYQKNGLYDVEVYEGIPEVLKALKKENCSLFIATSKPTIFAEKIARYLDIANYFTAIVGSNIDNTRSKKEEVIQYLLDHYNVGVKKRTIMVGDKAQDIIGAARCGIKAVGVTYGYGTIEELENAEPEKIVNSPWELVEYIRGI